MLAGRTCYDVMVRIMNYCMTTPERVLVLKQHGDWDRSSIDYKFEVMVKVDSNYAKMLGHNKKHNSECGVPEWSASNI